MREKDCSMKDCSMKVNKLRKLIDYVNLGRTLNDFEKSFIDVIFELDNRLTEHESLSARQRMCDCEYLGICSDDPAKKDYCPIRKKPSNGKK